MSEKAFEIKTITEEHKDEVLEFLRKYFYVDEPLNRYLNQTSNEPLNVNDRGYTSADSIKAGLSIMAVTPSNQIIGVTINRRYNNESEISVCENHTAYIQISKIIDKLEHQIADLAKLKNENKKEMNIRVISVHPEWRNKKVGRALIERSCEIAEMNGFNQIRSICTSEYSAKTFEKLGFHCVQAINYEDYKENGKIVFKPDPPHTHIKAMIFKI